MFCQTNAMRMLLLALLALSASAFGGERLRRVRPTAYSGMCDASAAVAISSNLFVVASDEDNILRLYPSDRASGPLKEYDFNAFLELNGKSSEADLEGAARIGDRAFWIGSHGRNRIGKERLNRDRLFATDIRMAGGEVSLVPAGKPFKGLLDALVSEPAFDRFHFAAAARLAPKEADALNIEGLAATPEGHLLIGFRNPIPKGKALLIPLLNPNEVIEEKPARFGPAIQLDLDGRGIRDVAWHDGTYIIIAGANFGGRNFKLYRWTGTGEPQPLSVDHLNRYSPEAVIIYPDRGFSEMQVLSDDGKRAMDGVPCNALGDPGRQMFRSFWVVK